MDDRQQQIQVGAGLQESRLNTDLIAFLEKWGTWILTAVLVVVAGYVGYAKWKEYHKAQHDDAFEQYASARGTMGVDGVLTGSPDNLLKIASDHGTRGAIAHLARLDAAEIKLGAVRRGLRAGTDLAVPKPEDALPPGEAAELTKQAGDLFTQVKNESASDPALALVTLRAHWGLAAVAVTSGDGEGARRIYGEIEQLAEKSGFPEQAEQAKKRLAGLDALATPPVLLSDKDLPAIAVAPPPAGAPGAGAPITISSPGGDIPVTRMPDDFNPTIVPSTPARTPDDAKPAEPTKPGEPFVIPPQQGQPGQPAPQTPPAEQPKP